MLELGSQEAGRREGGRREAALELPGRPSSSPGASLGAPNNANGSAQVGCDPHWTFLCSKVNLGRRPARLRVGTPNLGTLPLPTLTWHTTCALGRRCYMCKCHLKHLFDLE